MQREAYIKLLIKQKNMTYKQFAESIGMPYSTLLSILNNQAIGKASIDNIIKICRGLSITVDQLQYIVEQDIPEAPLLLSSHEEALVRHYRERTGLQQAVDILLGL